MSVLIGFLPWILFAYLASHNLQLSIEVGLLTTIVTNLPDIFHKKVKILNVGTLIFFVVLILLMLFPWFKPFEIWIGPASPGTLFLIALISILIKQPFTMQYAKESVPEEKWDTPLFKSMNLEMTGAWTVGFALMALCSTISIYSEQFKHIFGSWITLAITIILIIFNKLYPPYARKIYFAKHPEEQKTV